MNLTWKKTAAMIVGGLVTASLVAPVLADTPTTPTDELVGAAPGIHEFAPGFQRGGGGKGGFLGGDRGGKGPMMNMGQMAEKRGIMADVLKTKMPALGAQRNANQEQILADAAKGAGMTVEEYKAKLQADRQVERQAQAEQRKAEAEQKLAAAAAAANMTVDEYKAKLQADHQAAAIGRYAEHKGITVDEAKAQMKDQALKQMVSRAKALGITLDDVKAYFGQ